MNPDKENHRTGQHRKFWPLAICYFVATYLVFFLYYPFCIPIVIVHFLHAFRASKRMAVLAVALSPFVIVPVMSFTGGAVGYFSGTCYLKGGAGGPAESWNLDERYRCYKTSSGCLIDFTEIFKNEPNNVAIKILASAFGPVPGNYHGPYPTKEEAFSALRYATETVSIKDVKQVAEKLGLPEDRDLWRLELKLHMYLRDGKYTRPDVVKYAVFKDETAILGIGRWAVLVALKTGEAYAVYFNRDQTSNLGTSNFDPPQSPSESDQPPEG